MRHGEIGRRLLALCRRARMTAELEEEMQLHIALRANKLFEAGLDYQEAKYAAQRQFGNKTLLEEESREMWSWISIEKVLQDLRFAVRSLRKDAVFSAVAVATFALGIGANTAIFSVVNAVLLRPLPYPQSDAIVHMNLAWKNGELNDTLSVPEFEFYRDHSDALKNIAGYRAGSTVAMKRGDSLEYISLARVTDGFFRVLGIPPAIGRGIQRDETRIGANHVAVLSNSLWRNAFEGSSSVIGHEVEVDGVLYTIVGVMPSSFTFGTDPPDIFVPLQLGRGIADTGMNTQVIARLRPGTTLAQAQANIDLVFKRFRQQGLAQAGQRGIELETYKKWLAGDFRTSVLALFGAVGLLLLIACSNVASLLMARANARQRETSIRMALGAGRSRLLQQFLTESMLIAFFGGVAGILVAGWALKALIATLPWQIPAAAGVGIDAPVLAFTLLLIVATSLIFGFTSYWQVSRLSLNASLKEGTGRPTAARSRVRSALVVVEIALSLMLSVGAGLLIQSIYLLHQQKLGFDPRSVYTMITPFARTEKLNATQIWNFDQDVLRRLQAIPGVTSAAAVSTLPLTGPDNLPTQQEGHPEHSIGGMEYRAISSQYFKTMRIPILQGRSFRESDLAFSTPVAVVSEAVARDWWKGKSPIGDRIVVGEFQGKRFPEILEQPREVIGVAQDVKTLAINEAHPTTVYIPAAQIPRGPGSMAWVIRASGNSSLGMAFRSAVKAVKPSQRVLDIGSMPDLVARSMARPTFDASLMSTFAALALGLTSVGIYGLLSLQVVRRTREIGIRMSLGAKRASVLLLVLRQATFLTAVGVAFGIGGAVVFTRFLSSLLSGVRPTNPLTYALVSVLLFLVALVASYVPARRASKIDPLAALRHE